MKKIRLTLIFAFSILFANAQLPDRFAKMSDTVPTSGLATKSMLNINYYNKIQSDARFSPLSFGSGYIWNNLLTQQTSNFWISGFGRFTNSTSGVDKETQINNFGITATNTSTGKAISLQADQGDLAYQNNGFAGRLRQAGLTANRFWDLPDQTGELLILNPATLQTGNIGITGGITANGGLQILSGAENLSLSGGAAEFSLTNTKRNGIVVRGALGTPIVMFNDTNGGADRTGVWFYEKLWLRNIDNSTNSTHLVSIDTPSGQLTKIAISSFSSTVADIAAMQAYAGKSTTLIVKHHLRGGTFNLRTGLTPDGGTVFEATALGAGYYWQREMSQSDGYHVDWFGAISYDRNTRQVGDFDSRTAFQACIDALPSRTTPVILGYGVYMLSGPLVMGQGTLFKGKSTLWPRQYFGDGSLFIDYRNMTAVRYYNTTLNGFTTTTAVLDYRSQGIAFKDMGIFGPGRQYNTVGVALYRTENSTSPAKTTGLVTMENVYFADWGTATDGTNSTDTWYLERVHFADVKVGLIGGAGQTFMHHTDFFKIDSIGMILNSPNDPDVVSACEIETRYSSSGAIVVNGRAIISNTQFLTNKKSIIFNSTANKSIVNANTFIGNSDTDITMNSGATDVTISDCIFDKNYTTGSTYNYNFILETANYLANSIYASTGHIVLDNNNFIKSQGLYTGAPVLIDNCTIKSGDNKYKGYTYGNDENISFTGTNTKVSNYDIGDRKIVGGVTVGGNSSVTGNSSVGGNNTVTGNNVVTGKVISGLGSNSSQISAIGNTEDAAGLSSEAYGAAGTIRLAGGGGTFASPTSVTSGMLISQLKSMGYYGGMVTRGSIDFYGAETWGATNKGTYSEMVITPVGANSRVPIWRTTGTGLFIKPNATITPTAYLHLGSGSSSPGTAPMKFTSGPLNTSPEAGAYEFNGNRIYFTPTTTREQIAYASDLINYLFISVSTTAPTPTGTGTKGEVRYVSGYRYECTATNTWIRTAMDITW